MFFENSTYSYVYSNHLSNIRATYYRDNQTNQLVINSAQDYYPFGWTMPGRNDQNGERYRYGYQGEFAEMDEETGWNQFELRSYDPRLGRWMTIDPMYQHFSPYLAMGNNPVNRIDPDGGRDGDPTDNSLDLTDPTINLSPGEQLQYNIWDWSFQEIYCAGCVIKKYNFSKEFAYTYGDWENDIVLQTEFKALKYIIVKRLSQGLTGFSEGLSGATISASSTTLLSDILGAGVAASPDGPIEFKMRSINEVIYKQEWYGRVNFNLTTHEIESVDFHGLGDRAHLTINRYVERAVFINGELKFSSTEYFGIGTPTKNIGSLHLNNFPTK